MTGRSDLPTFLIIGAAKAGTTALYAMLTQHPQVYMPTPKEPHFFSYEGHPLDFPGPGDRRIMRHMTVTDAASYRGLFTGHEHQARGEASAMYLYVDGTAERIERYVPDCVLIAVLRDPVERAYSAFLHLRRDGREPHASFEHALDAEEERTRQGWLPIWHYRAMGLYARQLKRYQRTFGPDRVRVLLHEDLRTDAQGVVREIFARIGVDPTREVRTDVRRNVSGTAVSPTLQHLLSRPHPVKDSLKRVVPVRVRDAVVQRLRAANVRPAPAMAQDTQRELRSFFRSDVLELQDMIGRDLATWLA